MTNDEICTAQDKLKSASKQIPMLTQPIRLLMCAHEQAIPTSWTNFDQCYAILRKNNNTLTWNCYQNLQRMQILHALRCTQKW